MPSILKLMNIKSASNKSFKPYYKWNAFNTNWRNLYKDLMECFKPYYNWNAFNTIYKYRANYMNTCFKPYYNWNAFNTKNSCNIGKISI